MALRNRSKPDEISAEPLDTTDQEKLINELRVRGLSHERLTRFAFAVLNGIALVAVIYSFNALLMGNKLDHQVVLEFDASFGDFSLSYLGIIVELLFSIAIALNANRPQARLMHGLALVAASVPAIIFTPVLLHAQAPVVLWWLPFGALASLGITVYVDRDVKALLSDVDVLDGLKYQHKSI
jgi:hypothetical protein